MTHFLKKLQASCETRRSLLCVGLDPDPKRMPVRDVFEFNRAVIDATADLVCAFKPNIAFYEAMGVEGLKALEGTVKHIRKVVGNVLIIGDGKRGDLGPSMEAYYTAMFDVWGVDAVTVSPYLGVDSLSHVIDDGDKGIFVLCRTSNHSAQDFQDLIASSDGQELPLYQHVARKSREWNTAGNIGLVVGATYPQELKAVRELCPDMPILIPGVGAQGGSLEDAVRWGTDGSGRLAIINSSRQVLYASSGNDFPTAARIEAARLREQINQALAREGNGWS